MDSAQAADIYPPLSFDEFPVVTYAEWKEEAVAALKGGVFEKQLLTKTYEGITLEPIYTMNHAAAAARKTELPGGGDYLRGTSASGYINKPWVLAQAADGVLPKQVNSVLRRELQKGCNAVNIPLAESVLRGEEIGDADFKGNGMLLSTLNDMKTALEGVNLNETAFHIYAGISSSPVIALVAGAAEKSTIKKNFKGCIGADPIGVLAGTGTLPCDMDELYDEMALSAYWAKENAPDLRTVLVRGDVYHNGGGNAVQEAAYCVSTAVAYINAMTLRGLSADEAAAQIRFSFPLGANFFMESAKLRAARVLWSQVISAYGGSDEARKMDIFSRTSYFTSTVYDPYVNILRATSQAFSGVVGGANTMQVSTYDEAAGGGDDQSRRVARNIQLMFQNEFDMLRPVDPAGGSWYIESLTQQIAEKAWELFRKVEAAGGILEALKSGEIQAAVNAVLKERQKNLGTRRDRAVGTNMYANMTEAPLERACIAPEKIKAEWESREVSSPELDKLLEALPAAVGADPTLFIERILEAAKAGATLFRIRAALNDGFDADLNVSAIPVSRLTEQYEALRKRSEAYARRTGKDFRVFLANMGPIPQHKARADFTIGFMEVAHFKIIGNDGFATAEEAAEAAYKSGAEMAVICSTDDTYPELVPPLARLIKEKNPGMLVYLAGAPAPEMKDAYTDAGVDDFIHIRANCLEMLIDIQNRKGV